MSKSINKIPAGYRITSVSWENDGDNYRTVVIDGLSEKETKLIAEIGSLMKSEKSGLENNYEPSEKELIKGYSFYIKIFKKYADLFTEEKMKSFEGNKGFDGTYENYAIAEYINKKITGNSIEGYELRVLDNMKIEYFPEDILIEDVTKKFIK